MAVPKIVSILKPSIEKDDVVLIDRNDDRFADRKSTETAQFPDDKNIGSLFPYVSIRSVVIEYDELKSFEIICDGFLPEINLTVTDPRHRLTNVDFPLDGDVISVYIRPNDDSVQKSIRADFEIVDVDRSGTSAIYYNFYGVLRVPTIYDEVCQVKEGTSFDTLMSICSDLGLGFASNEDSTTDLQKWIVAKESREKFLQDITKYSYKDDNSFFTSFVDLFYNLNFINIQKTFSFEDVLEVGTVSTNQPTDQTADFKKLADDGPVFLTNAKQNTGANNLISFYAPFNNTGKIVRTNGYRRTTQFYDSELKELVDNFVEPLYTNGSDDKILLRGRKDETFFKTLHKFKYMGKQNDNTHSNYHFARILNYQNNEEISKAGLQITIDSLNTDIFRYRRIPIILYDRNNSEVKTSNSLRDEEVGDGNTTVPNQMDENLDVRNEFLSGFYVVESFIINYSPSTKYTTKAKLLRREWNDRGTAAGASPKPS
jgi:hypothetical protein